MQRQRNNIRNNWNVPQSTSTNSTSNNTEPQRTNILHQSPINNAEGHVFGNAEGMFPMLRINTGHWRVVSSQVIEQREERLSENREALENLARINRSQLNQVEIEQRINDEDDQAIPQASWNEEDSPITTWVEQEEKKNQQEMEEVPPEDLTLLIPNEQAPIENVNRMLSYWEPIRDVFFSFGGDLFLQGFVGTFINLTVEGFFTYQAPQIRNFVVNSVRFAFRRIFASTRPGTNPGAEHPPVQILQNETPTQTSTIDQQNEISSPPTTDISDWSQRPH